MRVSSLKIENFRGIRDGFVRFNKHAVLIGDNNAGKTTLIEALALLPGRDRLIPLFSSSFAHINNASRPAPAPPMGSPY